jgi:type IV pilus assembly protein PilV
MTEWLARVNAELPGAQVTVCFDATPFDAKGTPQWACSNTGSLVIKIGWTKSSTDKTKIGNDALILAATAPSVVMPVTAGSAL